jgi:lipopolysaccharide export system protein LptA
LRRGGRLSGTTLAAVVLLALAAGAIVYEVLRQPPEEAAPVSSPPPTRPDETARLEGGFEWRATEAGEALFDLEASTLIGIDAGIHLIESVDRLRIYMEDGRAVRLSAERGRIEPGDERGGSPRVLLERNVRVQDPKGLTLTTDRLVYDAGERAVWAEGPVRVEGAELQGTFGSLVYRPDARLMRASGAVDVALGPPGGWRVESGVLAYRLETGEVLFEEPMRARREGLSMLAGRARLNSDGGGGEMVFEGEAPVLLAQGGVGRGWQLSASRLLARGGGSPGGGVQLVRAGSPASLVRVGPGEGERAERVAVQAESWELEPDPEGGWQATAGPGFAAERSLGTTGAPWRLEGRWLEIDRDAAGRVVSVRGRGRVQVQLSEKVRMGADTLRWRVEADDRVLLDGTPARAWQGRDVIEAPRLVLLRDERELIAEGGATADVHSLKGAGLFGAAEPVRVRSERVFLPESERPILFDGRAQAWQGTSMLRSGLIRVDPDGDWLVAENDVVLRLGREEAGGLDRASRLMAERLEYLADERMARLRGATSYSAGDRRIRAEKMDLRVGNDGRMDSLIAEDDVALAVEGATGSGDRLEWTGGPTGTITLIGTTAPAQLKSAGSEGRPRVLDAPRISYDLETGAVSTRSGAGRSRVRTAPGEEPDPGEEGGEDQPKAPKTLDEEDDDAD